MKNISKTKKLDGKQPFGFPDVTKHINNHRGNINYTCEFCGIYTASRPRCNKCEAEK